MKNGEYHPNNSDWTAVVCERCGTFLGWITPKGMIGLFHEPCFSNGYFQKHGANTPNTDSNLTQPTASQVKS